MDVSVIISTRNRCSRLSQALESFHHLVIPPEMEWELIVVDNDSTDDTKKTVEEGILRNIVPIRYVSEKRKGKSFGLNAGISAARGHILAFTDDDCIVSPDWLTSILDGFARDPSTAGIGGRVELYNKKDKPYTVRTSRQPDILTPANLVRLIVGCNMALTRNFLDAVGEFDTTLGPGSRCCAGEDFDLLYRACRKGLRIRYLPEVLVYHNHGRSTDSEIRKLYKGYGISMGALFCKHILKLDGTMIFMAIQFARSVFVNSIRWTLLRRPAPPNRCTIGDLAAGAVLQFSQKVFWEAAQK